jgi:PhnB protein
MVTRLNPYINFRGDAKEAMEFYHSALGGEYDSTTFAEGLPDSDPSEADLVMHSMIETESGLNLMAADVPERMREGSGQQGSNISISLSGEDESELRGYWDKLSAGGRILEPLERAPWGDSFGMFVDKFGVTWLVNIAGVPA